MGSINNMENFLTTGQAAKKLSVTPDTVLKWIKSGKLDAMKTPGGHNRILEGTVNKLVSEKFSYKGKLKVHCPKSSGLGTILV